MESINTKEFFLEALEIARKAVDAASEKQASDILLLDMREVCSFADYFVICTGESEKQLTAIYSSIEQTLRKEGVKPLHFEDKTDTGWLLMDYGSVIVHIFAPFERDYYQLDRLWSSAGTLIRMQ